jgi:glycosyltransferase involved in cell wall biosynthesis
VPDRYVVDARGLELPLTGIGRYVASLLGNLPGGIPTGMVGVARPGVDVHPAGLSVRRLRPDAWNSVWNETRLAPYLRGARSYWATKSQVPWTAPRSCTVVSTVHDVFHHTHPDDFSLHRRLDLENAMRATVRRADVIAVTCRHVSSELRRCYGRSADVVVSPAATVPDPDPAAVDALRAQLPDHIDRWVLFVGNLVARKNLAALADAVATLPGVGLLAVGEPVDAAVVAALTHRPDVYIEGYADQHRLAAYFAVADALALVSHVEGFGLPLLDARAKGVPVVVSDRAPLPDNGGPHAVVVDPLSTTSIADGLLAALDAGPPGPEGLTSWGDGAAIMANILGLPPLAPGVPAPPGG